jgi:hypothetical protein
VSAVSIKGLNCSICVGKRASSVTWYGTLWYGRTIFYDTKEVEEEEEAQKVRQIGTHMM